MRDSCFMIPRQRHSKRSLFIRQIESIQSLGPFFLLLKISTLIRKQRREAITISFRLHPIAISQYSMYTVCTHKPRERQLLRNEEDGTISRHNKNYFYQIDASLYIALETRDILTNCSSGTFQNYKDTVLLLSYAQNADFISHNRYDTFAEFQTLSTNEFYLIDRKCLKDFQISFCREQ